MIVRKFLVMSQAIVILATGIQAVKRSPSRHDSSLANHQEQRVVLTGEQSRQRQHLFSEYSELSCLTILCETQQNLSELITGATAMACFKHFYQEQVSIHQACFPVLLVIYRNELAANARAHSRRALVLVLVLLIACSNIWQATTALRAA